MVCKSLSMDIARGFNNSPGLPQYHPESSNHDLFAGKVDLLTPDTSCFPDPFSRSNSQISLPPSALARKSESRRDRVVTFETKVLDSAASVTSQIENKLVTKNSALDLNAKQEAQNPEPAAKSESRRPKSKGESKKISPRKISPKERRIQEIREFLQ